jgi:S1-C subfamily serine protease
MSNDNRIWSLAEAFVSEKMSETELVRLKEELATDPAFADDFRECVNLLRSLDGSGKQLRFKALLKDIGATHTSETRKPTRTIPLKSHYTRAAAIAASVALFTSVFTYSLIQYNNKKIASQYSLLKRDLEKYKHSQNQLIRNINSQKATPPPAPVRFTGTGFALTNDGYLVTNYHVVEGADSIYIQNREGEYFKATVKSINPAADIAILKVNYKSFRFGKGEVPYTFASGKKGLGAKVYTLGYPQDEVVYNEGYISSKNGFAGDSSQYMLDLPANPGQSGAPVLDGSGNIIGIITGKHADNGGATYAVGSKALVRLANELDKKENLRLPKINKLGRLSQQDQIEKLEYYTCSIKVYKK